MANAQQSNANFGLRLPEFRGQGDDAELFLRKLDLLATKYRWEDQEKCFQLTFNLTGRAGSWYATLPDATQRNWVALKAAFESQFLNAEPKLITESKLNSRCLQAGESVDDYLADILSLGNKLNRSQDQLACVFINGLPTEMGQFCLGTDTHNLQNYTNRARLFFARGQSKANKADMPTNNIVAAHESKPDHDELVNAITKSLQNLGFDRHQENSRSRSRDSSTNKQRARSKSPFARSSVRTRSRDRKFNVPQNRRRRDEGQKTVRFRRGGCFICGSYQHWAKHCRNNQSN